MFQVAKRGSDRARALRPFFDLFNASTDGCDGRAEVEDEGFVLDERVREAKRAVDDDIVLLKERLETHDAVGACVASADKRRTVIVRMGGREADRSQIGRASCRERV